eukprot:4968574-Pyramimonas_sp.AAC.1
MEVELHADPATGAPRWGTLMGPRSVQGLRRNGRGTACGPCNWGLRRGTLWVTNRARGAPDLKWNCVRALPLVPSVEHPM